MSHLLRIGYCPQCDEWYESFDSPEPFTDPHGGFPTHPEWHVGFVTTGERVEHPLTHPATQAVRASRRRAVDVTAVRGGRRPTERP